MTNKYIRVLFAGMALTLVLGFVPAIALAHDGGSSGSNETETTSSGSSSGSGSSDQNRSGSGSETESEDQHTSSSGGELKTKLQQLKQQRQENKQHRLEENKLRVCEKRADKVQTIMNRSATRAERQVELFTTIAERVKKFYADKGYSLSNYDQLVAAVDAAKAKAESDLTTLKGQNSFDCNSDDPKGSAEAFKLALQSVRQDLKDYRTAVKNLIVGVKSANPEKKGEES